MKSFSELTIWIQKPVPSFLLDFYSETKKNGVDREVLVNGFKNGECPTNGFHVHLVGYGEG